MSQQSHNAISKMPSVMIQQPMQSHILDSEIIVPTRNKAIRLAETKALGVYNGCKYVSKGLAVVMPQPHVDLIHT